MDKLVASIRRFLSELRRRNVYQVGATYLVAGFVALQLAQLAAGAFGLPDWFEPMVWTLVGAGLPIALVIAWAFELTPEGVRPTPDAGRPDDTADQEEAQEDKGRPPAATVQEVWVGGSVLVLLLLGTWWLVGGLAGGLSKRYG